MTQTVARRDSAKQAAQARRLLANVTICSEVKYFTIEDEAGMSGQECAARMAATDFEVGYVDVARKQVYYIVPSKCEGRYYVVVDLNGEWVSSAKDARLAQSHIVKVVSYRLAASRADMTDADREAELRDSLAYDFGGDPCLVAKYMR